MSGSNEQKENIQRLAKGVKMKGPLGPVRTREPIRGKVTPFNENTFAPPSTAPASYTEPACNPQESDEETDTTEKQDPIDPSNPNTFVRGTLPPEQQDGQTTEQGVSDIGDAINDNTGPQLGGSGGNLRELVNLKDCDTGKEFNLHLDGNFVPPEGWDDPDTPPVNIPDGYEEGSFWYRLDPTTEAATDPVSVYRQIVESGSSTWVSGSVISYPSPTSARVRYTRISDEGSEGTFEDIAIKDSCAGYLQPNVVNACQVTEEDFSEESWPEDGTYDIAIKDGQFQTNLFDADAPEGFEPSGTKDFCYGDGSTGRAHVTADGGVMYYGTSEAGAPTGTARVVDSSGQLVAAGDATESFISQYLPQ